MQPSPQLLPEEQFISEIDSKNFMSDVIQASLSVPVLAYFTASWCAPCKQFGPLLEKIVNAAAGRVRLARIDVEKNPALAQQFRVQSVPMVYIFANGQPVDAFAGAMPEGELKQLLAPLMAATPEEEELSISLENADALYLEGNFSHAAGFYQAVLQQEPENIPAITGLTKCAIALQDLEQAEALLALVAEVNSTNEMVTGAKAMLMIAKSAGTADTAMLQAQLANNPDDHAARLNLASYLFMHHQEAQAVEELLFIVAKDKNWQEGRARLKLLELFEALGMENAVAKQGRRKLSAILFT